MKLEELIKKDKYQVFLFVCPATMPFSFGCHPWFVVNRKGTISRWEIFYRPHKWDTSWGHLHKNFYTPLQGISKYFFSDRYLWKQSKLIGYVEGDNDSLADRMANVIEHSPQTYPYCYAYSLKGPNSNTYIQWVLNQFPGSGMRLPWNAFGKNRVPKT